MPSKTPYTKPDFIGTAGNKHGSIDFSDLTEDFFEKLREVVKQADNMNGRVVQKKYLEKLGVYDSIIAHSPEGHYRKIIDCIRFILSDHKKCLVCNTYAKHSSEYCGISCRNKCSSYRAKVSIGNSANADTRKAAMKKTLNERYGVNAVQDIPAVKEKMKEKMPEHYQSWRNETFVKYGLDQDKLSDHEYLRKICKDKSCFEVMRDDFNGIPYTTLMRHFEHIKFDPEFKEGSSSYAEQEIYNFIKSLMDKTGEEVIRNNRKALGGLELDIYIPSRNFAVEFNGLYWHSENVLESKGNNAVKYHLNKFNRAEEAGIDLIQVFEDEWLEKSDIVKSIIKSKLGFHDKIYWARELKVSRVPYNDAMKFLEENHIQGQATGKAMGLYDGNTLVSLMTYSKARFRDDEFEIVRFCSLLNTQVTGAFTRLLKYVKAELNIDEIATYADLRYSTGKTYMKFGCFVSQSEPGFFWTRNTKRYSRIVGQKQNIEKFLGESVDLSKTQKEIMLEYGYSRIYDCGNRLYMV